MAFKRYTQTPKSDEYKPGDNVQFKVSTLRGHGWLLGQIWCRANSGNQPYYWIATDTGQYHEVHKRDLRMVAKRDHLCEPEIAERSA